MKSGLHLDEYEVDLLFGPLIISVNVDETRRVNASAAGVQHVHDHIIKLVTITYLTVVKPREIAVTNPDLR